MNKWILSASIKIHSETKQLILQSHGRVSENVLRNKIFVKSARHLKSAPSQNKLLTIRFSRRVTQMTLRFKSTIQHVLIIKWGSASTRICSETKQLVLFYCQITYFSVLCASYQFCHLVNKMWNTNYTFQVVTDRDELTGSVDYMNRGFHLRYNQIPCR